MVKRANDLVREWEASLNRLREERRSIREWLKSRGLTELEARDVAELHKLGGKLVEHAIAAGF